MALVCTAAAFLTRRDQMFIRPPTPPETRARASGLKASALTGVMWPFSWNTHTAPYGAHWEDWKPARERSASCSIKVRFLIHHYQLVVLVTINFGFASFSHQSSESEKDDSGKSEMS